MKVSRLFSCLSILFLIASPPVAAAGGRQMAAPRGGPGACGRAAVAGAVRSPSRLHLCRRVRLGEALAAAGSLSRRAEGVVQVLHADGSYDTYRLKDLRREKGGAIPHLLDGDIVSVR